MKTLKNIKHELLADPATQAAYESHLMALTKPFDPRNRSWMRPTVP